MDGFGFDVTPDDLHTAAGGITDAVGRLSGTRLADLIGGGADYGHDGLHGAVTEFVSTTNGALESYQRNAAAAHAALRQNATSYVGTDRGAGAPFGGR